MAGGLNGMNSSTPVKFSAPPQEAGRFFDAPPTQPDELDYSAFDPALMDMMQPEHTLTQPVPESQTSSLNGFEQVGLWKQAPTDTAERFGVNGTNIFDSNAFNISNRLEQIHSELPPQTSSAHSDLESDSHLSSLAEAMQRAQAGQTAPETSSERLTAQNYEQRRLASMQQLQMEIAAQIRQSGLKASIAGRTSAVELHTNERAQTPNVGSYTLFRSIWDSIVRADQAHAALETARRRQSQLSASKAQQGGMEGGADRKSDSVAAMQEQKVAQTVAAHEWTQGE